MQGAGLVRGQGLVEIADGVLKIRRGAGEVDEQPAAPAGAAHRDEAEVVGGVEAGCLAQRSVEAVDPRVVGAPDGAPPDLAPGPDQLVPAVAAGIEKGPWLSGGVSHQQDADPTHLLGALGARFGQLALPADTDPAVSPQSLSFPSEDRVTHIRLAGESTIVPARQHDRPH